MRQRLGEQVHIMVPGARLLFVRTPTRTIQSMTSKKPWAQTV